MGQNIGLGIVFLALLFIFLLALVYSVMECLCFLRFSREVGSTVTEHTDEDKEMDNNSDQGYRGRSLRVDEASRVS